MPRAPGPVYPLTALLAGFLKPSISIVRKTGKYGKTATSTAFDADR
jgi:hypothetical protein